MEGLSEKNGVDSVKYNQSTVAQMAAPTKHQHLGASPKNTFHLIFPSFFLFYAFHKKNMVNQCLEIAAPNAGRNIQHRAVKTRTDIVITFSLNNNWPEN